MSISFEFLCKQFFKIIKIPASEFRFFGYLFISICFVFLCPCFFFRCNYGVEVFFGFCIYDFSFDPVTCQRVIVIIILLFLWPVSVFIIFVFVNVTSWKFFISKEFSISRWYTGNVAIFIIEIFFNKNPRSTSDPVSFMRCPSESKYCVPWELLLFSVPDIISLLTGHPL